MERSTKVAVLEEGLLPSDKDLSYCSCVGYMIE
jgi:hypothetical protein